MYVSYIEEIPELIQKENIKPGPAWPIKRQQKGQKLEIKPERRLTIYQ